MTNLETNYLLYPEAIKEAVQPGYDSGLKEDRWLGTTLLADSAELEGVTNSTFNLYTETEPHYIFWNDRDLTYPAKAVWVVNIPHECDINISLDLGPTISSNKHIYNVSILKDSIQIGAATEGEDQPNGYTDSDLIKVLSGTIHIPSAGEYVLELTNDRSFCKGSVKNIIIERV